MAYLLAPVVNFFEVRLFSAQVEKAREKGRFAAPAVRAASLLLTWLLVCLMFYILASVLLPELYKSVFQLVSNVENYYNTIAGWVESLLATYPDMENLVVEQMNAYYQDITSWLNANNIADWVQKALSQAQTVMSVAAGSLMGMVNF
jgi:predicted PurR-regulated permease PerM